MKFSQLALLSLLAAPVAAEVYFKEQFNDEVRNGFKGLRKIPKPARGGPPCRIYEGTGTKRFPAFFVDHA
jgi:hypothetical protein